MHKLILVYETSSISFSYYFLFAFYLYKVYGEVYPRVMLFIYICFMVNLTSHVILLVQDQYLMVLMQLFRLRILK